MNFLDIVGPEPEWLACTLCGAMTARVPCWDCDRNLAAKADTARARAVALGSLPARFAWSNLESLELRDRVRLRDARTTIAATATRVLSSARAIFAGPSGSGKTSLAVACLRERLPHGLFVSALRLGTARIQHAAGDGDAGLVDRAIAAPLLLVDEVGGEVKTATNAVRDVVFARYDADLPTWVTTGFRGAQLAEMYGDGFLRRLNEGAFVVQLGGSP